MGLGLVDSSRAAETWGDNSSVCFVLKVRVLELENQLQKERQKLGELRKKHYELAGVAEGWEEDGECGGCCRRACCWVLLPSSRAIKPQDLGATEGPSGRAHCPTAPDGPSPSQALISLCSGSSQQQRPLRSAGTQLGAAFFRRHTINWCKIHPEAHVPRIPREPPPALKDQEPHRCRRSPWGWERGLPGLTPAANCTCIY